MEAPENWKEHGVPVTLNECPSNAACFVIERRLNERKKVRLRAHWMSQDILEGMLNNLESIYEPLEHYHLNKLAAGLILHLIVPGTQSCQLNIGSMMAMKKSSVLSPKFHASYYSTPYLNTSME